MKHTKTPMRILAAALSGLLAVAAARAADVSGQWRAEFDTQIGLQKYLYTFHADGGKLTGKAAAEVGDQKREVVLREGRIEGDTLTFVEMFKFQDNEVRIECQGKIGENEIKFTRKVGDFATEELAAKRVQVAAAPLAASPTNAAAGDRPRRGPGGFGGPVVLGPDDKPAFADPPAGFDVKREGIARGRMEMIEYDSKTVGTRRKVLVYTPPGHSAGRKYPVLYLLHGIGGDETEWQRFAHPDVILDNLLADQSLVYENCVSGSCVPGHDRFGNDSHSGRICKPGTACVNWSLIGSRS